jgi:hypothetical protein
MAIRKSTAAAPAAEEYMEEEERPRRARRSEEPAFEAEDENETADVSSFVQVGWAAAKKAHSTTSGTARRNTEFRFSESAHLVKFLDAEPIVFAQHWVDKAPTKKSFVCIKNGCPLCDRGNAPSTKYGFRVVDLGAEDLFAQIYVATPTAFAAVMEQNEGRFGPVDSGYWELSKTGEGKQSRTVVRAVKERDLPEDWDIDPKAVASDLRAVEDPGVSILRVPTAEDLREAADYC